MGLRAFQECCIINVLVVAHANELRGASYAVVSKLILGFLRQIS